MHWKGGFCSRGAIVGGWIAAQLCAVGFLAAGIPGVASAAGPPALSVPLFGQFRSVLAQGEGQTINSLDLASYEASNTPPDSFVNQQPLYAGVMPHAASLSPGNLDTYYKGTGFGAMPGGVGSVTQPGPARRSIGTSSSGWPTSTRTTAVT